MTVHLHSLKDNVFYSVLLHFILFVLFYFYLGFLILFNFDCFVVYCCVWTLS